MPPKFSTNSQIVKDGVVRNINASRSPGPDLAFQSARRSVRADGTGWGWIGGAKGFGAGWLSAMIGIYLSKRFPRNRRTKKN